MDDRPDRGTVSEEAIDDRAGDFGRVNDSFVGLQSNMVISCRSMARAIVRNVFGPNLYKYDLRSGLARSIISAKMFAALSCFAASARDGGEDAVGSWATVHSEKAKSKFVILDAQTLRRNHSAIELPFRVPYGARGNWIPAESVH